jgi:alcohol dehydrogenase (NADP+)
MSDEKNCQCHDHGPSRRAVMTAGVALSAAAAVGDQAHAASALPAKGFAARSPTSGFAPFAFKRREVGPKDVLIDILYCGICHSDIHTARFEWTGTKYPCVPGHEILGRVLRVGKEVSRFKPGDIAAVGCLVDSCGHCEPCKEGLEQYCENGYTMTYDSDDKQMGTATYGGYSNLIVVTDHFVVKVPAGMNLPGAAPLLCAGVTTFSPMRHWQVKKGTKVGVVGIGGLGHVGVKIAAALGAEVTAISTTPGKLADAAKLGAKDAFLSTDANAIRSNRNRFDFLLSTIPQSHDLMPYVSLLRHDGVLVLLGAIDARPVDHLYTSAIIVRRKTIAGSCIGGLAETQEMLDFCAANGIAADTEIVGGAMIDKAYDRIKAKDVRYRFVIDMKKSI